MDDGLDGEGKQTSASQKPGGIHEVHAETVAFLKDFRPLSRAG